MYSFFFHIWWFKFWKVRASHHLGSNFRQKKEHPLPRAQVADVTIFSTYKHKESTTQPIHPKHTTFYHPLQYSVSGLSCWMSCDRKLGTLALLLLLLCAWSESKCSCDHYEPNNSQCSATLFGSSTPDLINATICPAFDQDYYVLSFDSARLLTISLAVLWRLKLTFKKNNLHLLLFLLLGFSFTIIHSNCFLRSYLFGQRNFFDL